MLRTVTSVPVISSSPNKQMFESSGTADECPNESILFNLNKNALITKRKKKNSDMSSDDDNGEDSAQKSQKLLAKENDEDDDDDFERVEEDDNFLKDDEKNLENLVFGSDKFMVDNISKIQNKSQKAGLKFNKFLSRDEENLSNKVELADAFQSRKPAWEDNQEEDENKTNLVNKFNKYYGTPIWADLETKKKKKQKKNKKLLKSGEDMEEEDEDEEDSDSDSEENTNYFQQTGNFLAESERLTSAVTSLPKTTLDIKMCTDANKEEPHQARLKCVEFHPSARVMLTAGLNQKLTLFQIDGKKNAKIQTIFIEKFPILSAHFTKLTGDEIIMGSRHKNFYYYDMNSGKIISVQPPVKAIDEYQRSSISSNFEISPDNRWIAFIGSQGQIHLFSCKSKEWINTIKINDSCNAVTFSSDARYLFAFGDDKDVHVFDMNDRGHKSLYKFTDFGCLSGTSIAVSNNSQFIATGCKSGVVNIYNLNESSLQAHNRNPKPLKSFMNLTTPCTSLKFNSTNEILAACSSYAENACKLIHVGSLSVFANFPQNSLNDSQSQIRIPQCIDFSMNSGYFTIGNHKGNALLYRLKHYGSF